MHILRVSRLETAVPIRSPKKMKTLVGIIITIFGISIGLAEETGENWMTFYYKAPSPDAFSKEVLAMADRGLLKDENAQAPIIAFLSQVMSANPKRIPEWIDEASDLDEKQYNALLAAAWYSDTAEARDLFKKQERDAYLNEKAPDILVIDVNNPSTLDMLWGYFMATGDSAPVRRIVSALSLSKYSGALDRFKTSEKTEKDKKEAYLDVTFQAAQWSLESNCKAHPRVLAHCEAIFADKVTPKDQSLWLGVILSKVKPEKYSVEIGKNKREQGGARP